MGREEIYWRMVHPNELSDKARRFTLMPSLAWALGYGSMSKNSEQVKVWIALYCELGLNALRVMLYSQKGVEVSL